MTNNTRKAPRETAKVQALRAALVKGEKSGMSPRTPEDIRADVRNRKTRDL